MSDNSLVSFATLDGGDDGEEVQTCGAGAYTGADDDAQGTCWIEDSARARSRTGEGAVGLRRGHFDHGAATPARVQSSDDLSQRRSEEHTSELQSRRDLVCRLLLEKKKK